MVNGQACVGTRQCWKIFGSVFTHHTGAELTESGDRHSNNTSCLNVANTKWQNRLSVILYTFIHVMYVCLLKRGNTLLLRSTSDLLLIPITPFFLANPSVDWTLETVSSLGQDACFSGAVRNRATSPFTGSSWSHSAPSNMFIYFCHKVFPNKRAQS